MDNFDTVLDQLEKAGINVGIKHFMNSLGLLRFKDKQYDMVRVSDLVPCIADLLVEFIEAVIKLLVFVLEELFEPFANNVINDIAVPGFGSFCPFLILIRVDVKACVRVKICLSVILGIKGFGERADKI